MFDETDRVLKKIESKASKVEGGKEEEGEGEKGRVRRFAGLGN